MFRKPPGSDRHAQVQADNLGNIAQGDHSTINDRRLQVGRDLVNSLVISGDSAQVFVGPYQSLRDAYLTPTPVLERVRLDRFAGRGWLTARLDAFLRTQDRGYFLIEAPAGLGKTTYLAHLVRERAYVHHFPELPGGHDPATARRSLAAQLLRAWLLESEVAALRDAERPGEPIVLAVDALDELPAEGAENLLGLPRRPPPGVYVVATQRPVPVALAPDPGIPREVARLEPLSDDNQGDIDAYLQQMLTWEPIGQAVADSGHAPETVRARLKERSEGVWVYLHFVLEEIAEKVTRPDRPADAPPALDLDALPHGLWQYYARYWLGWADRDGWTGTYRPVLATLAAAQEPLTLEPLGVLAGAEAPRQTLHREWRPFLDIRGEGPTYRLYHPSLREFIEGRGDAERLNTQEQDFVADLAAAARGTHRRIAGRYLKAWGGLDAGLPQLAEPDCRDLDGAYGLRHIAAHLEHGGQSAMLDRLLALESPRPDGAQNLWFKVREQVADTAGFLADVARAWRLAEHDSKAAIEAGKPAASIGRELRYALITTSVNSLAANLPAELLAALVRGRIWQPEQAVAYARRIPDPEHRREALTTLADVLDANPALRTLVLAEALQIAGAIDGEYRRAQALGELAPHLPEPQRAEVLAEALQAAGAIDDGYRRAQALAQLAPHLPEPQRAKVLAAEAEIGTEGWRFEALNAIVAALVDATVDCPLGHGYELWGHILGLVAVGSRSRLLESLGSLQPLMLRLGGPQALAEVTRAIQDVGRWWP